MAGSDSLLIVIPPVWVSLVDAETWFPQWDMSQIRYFIDQASWSELDALVEVTGQIPAGHMITQALLIEPTSVGSAMPQLLMQFAPVPPQP